MILADPFEGFLARLARAVERRRPRVEVTKTGRLRLHVILPAWECPFCPVTFVAWASGRGLYPGTAVIHAGRAIGLSDDFVHALVDASDADPDYGFDPALRQRLLTACGTREGLRVVAASATARVKEWET